MQRNCSSVTRQSACVFGHQYFKQSCHWKHKPSCDSLRRMVKQNIKMFLGLSRYVLQSKFLAVYFLPLLGTRDTESHILLSLRQASAYSTASHVVLPAAFNLAVSWHHDRNERESFPYSSSTFLPFILPALLTSISQHFCVPSLSATFMFSNLCPLS